MAEIVANLFVNGLSLAAICILGCSAFGIGRTLIFGLRIPLRDPLATLVWCTSLGLVVASLFCTVLGLVRLLYVPVLVIFTISSALWGCGEILQCYALRRQQRLTQDAPGPIQVPVWLKRILLAVTGVVALATLLAALAPPTAGDALCYHLELPKEFLHRHALVFLPFADNSTFPLLAEMGYLWGLAFAGPVGAQLMSWGTGLLLMLAAVLIARPYLGEAWSWLIGLCVLLTPGVTTQMTAPFNDLSVALWVTLSLVAWHKAVVEQESRKWLILSGVMLGAALATKHTALLFAGSAGLVWGVKWFIDRARWRGLPQSFAIVACLALIVASPWYIRSALHRGDPLFPIATQWFDRGESAPPLVDKTFLSLSASEIFTSPWQITMWPEHFGGYSHQLGPLFLMLLPGLVFVRRLRGLNTQLAIAAIYFLGWFVLRQNVRFLYVVLPLLATAAIWGVAELERMPAIPKRVSLGILYLLLGLGCLLPVYRLRDKWRVAAGLESRRAYLCRVEPSFPAANILNHLAGRQAQLLSEDYRGFYFQGQFTRESIYRRLTHYEQTISHARDMSTELKKRGFTHLLLLESQDGVNHDRTLSRMVAAELATYDHADHSPLLSLASYSALDADGCQRHYRLIALR